MKLPSLKIGNLEARIPIMQGGMGVGISMSGLASAVSNAGGIGVISGLHLSLSDPKWGINIKKANIEALREEIRKARKLAPSGIIGVNILVAITEYATMVKTAVEEGIDLVISGAGLPLNLPEFIKGTHTKAVPIVSSAKAASIICKSWDRKHDYCPDAVVVEGPLAGGHLGFKKDELDNIDDHKLEDIVPEVIEAVKPYEEKYGKKIPVIAAGGIFDGKDIAKFLKLGASGVQMATRFVATYECDASLEFKQAYINARKEDIVIIKSPVGMPGRAIKNSFLDDVEKNNKTPDFCQYNCLASCDPKKAPYCIAQALLNAQKGNLDEGFAFCGQNAYRVDKIVHVDELMDELVKEAEENM
ncbi:MAG: nitronate monooxygenase family protein [Thermoanaerobacteraceae bacterium]|nr:nitronate monooxygenase family protein [Thermoanaerobacteraceae bacterium]